MWLRVARCGAVALIPEIILEYRLHPGQWKPPDIQRIREEIFEAFIQSLPVPEQPRGRRIRACARWSARADAAFAAHRWAGAFGCYLRAISTAPSLALSPLVGPPFLWGAKKALLSLVGLRKSQ